MSELRNTNADADSHLPGNAAAMREALGIIQGMATCGGSDFGNPAIRGLLDQMERIRAIANAALSAPPRNCDLFKDGDEARYAWLHDRENWDELGDPKLEACDWLLAAAKKVDAERVNPKTDSSIQATSAKGYWLNGDDFEYEFAYCSECGRMQWADWGSHAEAREKIHDFHNEYKYCPECGAKMEGGRYGNE